MRRAAADVRDASRTYRRRADVSWHWLSGRLDALHSVARSAPAEHSDDSCSDASYGSIPLALARKHFKLAEISSGEAACLGRAAVPRDRTLPAVPAGGMLLLPVPLLARPWAA